MDTMTIFFGFALGLGGYCAYMLGRGHGFDEGNKFGSIHACRMMAHAATRAGVFEEMNAEVARLAAEETEE